MCTLRRKCATNFFSKCNVKLFLFDSKITAGAEVTPQTLTWEDETSTTVQFSGASVSTTFDKAGFYSGFVTCVCGTATWRDEVFVVVYDANVVGNDNYGLTLERVDLFFDVPGTDAFRFHFSHNNIFSSSVTPDAKLMDRACSVDLSGQPGLGLAGFDIVPRNITGLVDVDFDKIVRSAFWVRISPAEGGISFCFRTEVVEANNGSPQVVNFFDTVVDVFVDLTAEFTVTGYDVRRNDVSEAQGQVDVFQFYKLRSYRCESDGTPVEEPLAISNGGFVRACVLSESSNANVNLVTILDATVSQTTSSLLLPAVQNGAVTNTFTSLSCAVREAMNNQFVCMVTVTLTSAFFVGDAPPVTMSGNALMALGSRRELVQAPVVFELSYDRDLQNSSQDSSRLGVFSVDAELVSSSASGSAVSMITSALISTLVVPLIV